MQISLHNVNCRSFLITSIFNSWEEMFHHIWCVWSIGSDIQHSADDRDNIVYHHHPDRCVSV